MKLFILLLMFTYSHNGAAVAQPERQRQQEADQQISVSPAPTPSVQPSVEIRELQVAPSETERGQRTTVVDERSPWPAWIANIISALVLLFLAFQTYINRGMLKSMETNEGLLGSQCEALTALAEATKKQFDSMEKQLTEMSKQTTVADAQATALREQLVAMQEAADMAKGQLVALQHQEQALFASLEESRRLVAQNERAVRAAEENVKTVEKTAIYSNRAYVVAKIRDIGPYDDQFMFRLRIQNNGNTPANDVVVSYAYGLREIPPHKESPEGLVVYDIGYTETERLGLVAPQSSYHVISTPTVQYPYAHAHPDENAKWESGDLGFYCWGEVVYEDIFNEKRRSAFCFVISVKHKLGYPASTAMMHIEEIQIKTLPLRKSDDTSSRNCGIVRGIHQN